MSNTDITHPSIHKKHISGYEDLEKKIAALRVLGKKIIVISGTWDLLHIGHCRYLQAAKELAGDPENAVLIVGVDSDQKVKSRKGPSRPIVPEEERVEMLCHTKYVDFAIIKNLDDGKWRLIKTAKPDILVTTERMKYSEEEQKQLQEFCGQLAILDSQAKTSTSAKIRLLTINFSETFKNSYTDLVNHISDKMKEFHDSIDGLHK